MDEDGKSQEIQGIVISLKLRPVIASELAKCIPNGCHIYAIQVRYSNSKEISTALEDIPVVLNFPDVFSEKILGLPTKRGIYFTIELVLGAAPVS